MQSNYVASRPPVSILCREPVGVNPIIGFLGPALRWVTLVKVCTSHALRLFTYPLRRLTASLEPTKQSELVLYRSVSCTLLTSKMTTTTMHFGPEWMRTKGSARPAPSPPLNTSAAPAGASSYSALVTPVSNPAPERRDTSNPFRYSREELLRIYKEGGGRGGLGLEVERWEGIVREVGYDPVAMKDMSEAEKKVTIGVYGMRGQT